MNFYNKEVRCIGCGLYFCCSKCRCIHEENEHKIKRDTKTLVTDFRQLCQEYGVEEISVLSKKRLIQQFETLYEEDESESTVKPAAESPTTTDKPPVFSTPEQLLECVTPEESPQSDSEMKQKIIYTPHSNTAKLIYSPKGKFRFNYREFVARKAIEKAEDSSLDANESPPPNPKEGSGDGVANPIKQVSTSTPTGSLLGEWAAFQEQVAEESISVIIGTLKENLQHNLTQEMSKSDLSANLSKLKGIIVNRNVDMTSSFNKSTKSVKFAENTVFTPSTKVRNVRVFRKPSRKLTPGPQKRYSNNPKFKALIEAFENKQIPSTTPVTCNSNYPGHPARAINFKDDSSKENRTIDENVMSTTQNCLITEEMEDENKENNETENNDNNSKIKTEPMEIKLGPTPSKEICRATTPKEKEICRATATTSANHNSGPDNLEACVDELMSIIKLNVKQFIKNPEVAVTLDRKKKLRVIIEVVIDEVNDTTLKITNTPTIKNEPEAEVKNSAIAIEDCNTPVSRLTKSDSLDSSGSKRKYDFLKSEDHDHDHENCHGPSKYKKYGTWRSIGALSLLAAVFCVFWPIIIIIIMISPKRNSLLGKRPPS